MAVKSVIDVEINDSDFQRYAAAFSKYQEELRSQPGIWSKVSESAGDASAAAAEMGTAVGAAFFALHKISGENNTLTRNTQRQASAWQSMANSATKFTTKVIEATRSLLRWGELTGLISGILGAGGLFGIDRLAISATQQRSRAFQLSGTPGEVAAVGVDLARFTDTNAFMSNINRGITDVTSPAYLAMMNAGAHPEKQTDAASAAFNTILALKDAVDKIPKGPLFGTTMHTMKYDELMPSEDLIKLRNMSREEVQTQVTRGRQDTARMEITPDQTRIWNDLQTSFNRTSTILKRDLIVRLTDLAPALEHLSVAFLHLAEVIINNPNMQKWIDSAASAIDKFAKYLESPKIEEDINHLMDYINSLGGKFSDLVEKITDTMGGVEGLEKDFQKGVDAAKIFGESIDLVARKLAEAAHAIIDPWTKGVPPTKDEADQWNRAHPENQIPTDSLPEGQGDATGWDRLKNWWGGGRFSGPMMHPTSYRTPTADGGGGDFSDIEDRHGLPPGLLNAVEQTESGGRDVTSPAGAQGYFQFMPATAARFNVDPHDEMSSARGAGVYYRQLLDEFHGDVAKAAAGYNWGEGNVRKDVEQYGARWREHLPDETKAYVDRVLRRTEQNQMASGPRFVPNQGRPASVAINVNNQTGGNSYISASQLAVG